MAKNEAEHWTPNARFRPSPPSILHDGARAFLSRLITARRRAWRSRHSRQDSLPFAPSSRIISGETLNAGKMGNDHGMAVGAGLHPVLAHLFGFTPSNVRNVGLGSLRLILALPPEA